MVFIHLPLASFLDIIKGKALEAFSGQIPLTDMLWSILTAFGLAAAVCLVYRVTFSGVVFQKSFVLALLLLAMITAMVIRTISSNLVFSLGMVGALSIVRFRTAVKDVTDTVFMFFTITIGIICGAGQYLAAFLGTMLTGLIYTLVYCFSHKLKSGHYLFTIHYAPVLEGEVAALIKSIKNAKVKSRVTGLGGGTELAVELLIGEADETRILSFEGRDGVYSLHLVGYDSAFSL
ncbi:MAG: DUF4956 domain-containing protein [Oscillospiraceae bacterium]|jgi:uncharacterized membrane protein YhiD involved in acid resistance|nr:DUF4956 domain-containing protein [Oscillospiraceae bacterium]